MYVLTYYHSQQLVYLHVVLHHTVTTTYFSYTDQWHVNMVPVEPQFSKWHGWQMNKVKVNTRLTKLNQTVP